MPLSEPYHPLQTNKTKKSESFFKGLIGASPSIAIFIIALLWTSVRYSEGKFTEEFPDFKFQIALFIWWGLVGIVIGLNIGWRNPNAKFIWTCIDIVWISTALLSLVGMISPVEQQVMAWRAEDEAKNAKTHQTYILNEATMGAKYACAPVQDAAHCAQWQNFHRELTAPPGRAVQSNSPTPEPTPQYTHDRLKEALPKLQRVPATMEYIDHITEAQKGLIKALGNERKASSIIGNVDLSLPYLNVFILVVALCLRAGKSGADLPKGWAELIESRSKKEKTWHPGFVAFPMVWPKGLQTDAHIRAAEINYAVQADGGQHTVISLGSNALEQLDITLLRSLDNLEDKFPMLAKAELRNVEGSLAGNVLINMERVIIVEKADAHFIVHFANGRKLRIGERIVRAESASRVVAEPA